VVLEEAKEFRLGSSTLGAYRGLQDIVSLTAALSFRARLGLQRSFWTTSRSANSFPAYFRIDDDSEIIEWLDSKRLDNTFLAPFWE
jgi:hypothetical protein